MSRRDVIRLVAGREISERLHSRAVRISTAILTVAVVAAVVLPGLIQSSSKPTRVGLVGEQAQALGSSLTATARAVNVRVRIYDVPDAASARAEVKRGKLDVAVIVGSSGATAIVPHTLSPEARALLSATLTVAHQRAVLGAAGLSPDTIRAALTPVPLATVAIAPPPSHQAARSIAAIAAALCLYLVLVLYGNAVATGVAQEKTSRTAEVLISIVRPEQLLVGKVVGIGAVGLGQLTVPVIAALIANAIEQSAKIPSDVWFLLPASLLFFALGYAFYAFAFAAAGATVARQEEVQIATVPLSIPLLAGYLLASILAGNPHSPAIVVLSFVPLLTPSLMPARIAVGTAPWWQVILAVLIMLASIYGMVRLTTRIYKATLVRSGPRLSWREALRVSPQ
jgi:ABC-2 type transport system permease protein